MCVRLRWKYIHFMQQIGQKREALLDRKPGGTLPERGASGSAP